MVTSEGMKRGTAMNKFMLYVAGYFDDERTRELTEYAKKLEKENVILSSHNLSDEMYQSVFDFMDLEKISFGYEVVRTFIYSGAYDVFKYWILKLWNILQNKDISLCPFTIEIKGIPTLNGTDNIKCKITGELSEEQKTDVIDKTFALTKQITDNQFQLMEKSVYYDAFNAHIFKYDLQKKEYVEMDILKEVEKIRNKEK